MSYLLDTCVLSEIVKPRPNAAVVHWVGSVDEERLYLSVITLGEIQKGITQLRDQDRRQGLAAWLSELADRFRPRLLPLDAEVLLTWGRITGAASTKGITLPTIDSLIAATAQVHQLTVVTRNATDLERSGASVLNPWALSR